MGHQHMQYTCQVLPDDNFSHCYAPDKVGSKFLNTSLLENTHSKPLLTNMSKRACGDRHFRKEKIEHYPIPAVR